MTDVLSYSPWLERQGLAPRSEPELEITHEMLKAGYQAARHKLNDGYTPGSSGFLTDVYRAMHARAECQKLRDEDRETVQFLTGEARIDFEAAYRNLCSKCGIEPR